MNHAAVHAASRRRQLGLTFVELMMAMTATALIGLAIASMLFATTYGTEADKDLRSMVVKHKVLNARLSAAIRASKMVLAQGTDYLVLWMDDTTGEGEPNLSEIRLIHRDAATDELSSYLAPANPAPDTEYPIASTDFNDFGSATLPPIKGTANLPQSLWATGVTDWPVTLDDPTVQSARLVAYQITLQVGTLSDTSIGQSSLRN